MMSRKNTANLVLILLLSIIIIASTDTINSMSDEDSSTTEFDGDIYFQFSYKKNTFLSLHVGLLYLDRLGTGILLCKCCHVKRNGRCVRDCPFPEYKRRCLQAKIQFKINVCVNFQNSKKMFRIHIGFIVFYLEKVSMNFITPQTYMNIVSVFPYRICVFVRTLNFDAL